MKILSLRSENVKRLTAIEIRPDGAELVVIGGPNGAGKSSCLDSIMYALAGDRSLPPDPVRHGAEEAVITIELDDYIVTKTISPDGKTALKVMGKDGGKFAGPQTILNNIIGNLSFDPLAFSRMDPKEQVNTMMQIGKLDFSALDRQKAAKSEERVLVGREVKQLQGQLKGMVRWDDAPAAEVSIADLSKKLGAAREINSANKLARDKAASSEKSHGEWSQRVRDLKAELAEAEAAAITWAATARADKAAAAVLRDADEQAIVDAMGTIDAQNQKARDNASRIKVSSKLDQKEAAYSALSENIQNIELQKSRALEAAKFPVPSLSFNEAGVLVAGVPFQQASQAEQLRVSVAMGIALNPKLKVLLVRDASLLDSKSMGMMGEMAAAAGAQIWLERVSDGDASAIIIEEGRVARVNPPAASRQRVVARA